MLDVSYSMSSSDVVKEVEFVSDIIDAFHVGQNKTRVAALTFGEDADLIFDFDWS